MVDNRCPLCKSPCIIKVIATDSEQWCEVDVCKMCGTMYPRDTPSKRPKAAKKKARAKPRPKKAVKRKKTFKK